MKRTFVFTCAAVLAVSLTCSTVFGGLSSSIKKMMKKMLAPPPSAEEVDIAPTVSLIQQEHKIFCDKILEIANSKTIPLENVEKETAAAKKAYNDAVEKIYSNLEKERKTQLERYRYTATRSVHCKGNLCCGDGIIMDGVIPKEYRSDVRITCPNNNMVIIPETCHYDFVYCSWIDSLDGDISNPRIEGNDYVLHIGKEFGVHLKPVLHKKVDFVEFDVVVNATYRYSDQFIAKDFQRIKERIEAALRK